jgi:glycosyltransferase involved in cell wall biosynthesis
MKPITIAIPFYNAEKYLEETVESVLQQSFKDFYLLLIDDGSTDNSVAIAQKLAAKDSRVQVFSDGQNKNLGYRLNQIPSLVQTEFLVRMDADDIMHPEKIEKQYQTFLENPEIDVLGTNVYSIDDKNLVFGIRNEISEEKIMRITTMEVI